MNSNNALTIASSPTLDSEDCEFILRALDLLERSTQADLATDGNSIESSPLLARWSRLLIVREKLRVMREALSTSEPKRDAKDGTATAIKQLNVAYEDLGQVDAFMFVCMQALQTKSGDDVGPCVSAVLSVAYDKLVLDVNQNIREAIEALDRDGGAP